MPKLKIVCILQNQWFKDPESIKRMFAENPERRERYISAFLFMGCRTGKVLQSVFGEELCDRIIWEEASPEVGGVSSAAFPPDQVHISQVIIKHKPDVVIALGKIAIDGINQASKGDIDSWPEPITFQYLTGPHPTSRNNPLPRLREIADRIKAMEQGGVYLQEVLEKND